MKKEKGNPICMCVRVCVCLILLGPAAKETVSFTYQQSRGIHVRYEEIKEISKELGIVKYSVLCRIIFSNFTQF